MSYHSSRGVLGRSSPPPAKVGQTRSAEAVAPTTRKRSNTKYGNVPPPLQLPKKPSMSSFHKVTSNSANLNQDAPRNARTTSGGRSRLTSSVFGRDAASPLHTTKYGTHITASPLATSPDALSILSSDIVSSSLPVTLSALAGEPDLELVSPPVVSDQRRPSSRDRSPSSFLSSYTHGQPSSSLSSHTTHSNPNLRVPASQSSSRTTSVSAPASRKSSAGSTDRDRDRDAGHHLDMKRLLSKPAKPSHSGSSIISLTSDAEHSSASPSPRRMQSFAQQAQLATSSQRKMGVPPSKRISDFTPSVSAPHPRQTLKEPPSRISLPSAAATNRDRDAGPKPRNVLRRKSSARSNPSTPTTNAFKPSAPEPISRSSSRTTRAAEPSRASVPRRAASATAQPVPISDLGRAQAPPVNLTPAGAVAHAYKQQEQRREKLAEIASGSTEQLNVSGTHRAASPAPNLSHQEQPEEDSEEPSGVYYTVFGSTAGKVVAVGKAEDSSWDIAYDAWCVQDSGSSRPTTKQSSSSSAQGSVTAGVRTLTRKVSGRFRKATGGSRKDTASYDARDTASTHRQPDEPFDGRPLASERRSMSSPPTRALGPSMDEYVDVSAVAALPSVQNGSREKNSAERKESRTLRTMRSFVVKEKEKEAEKERDDESSPGGKIWKLMKRISAGGLRDKYVRESAPPPVPALPKDFKSMAASRTTFDIRDPELKAPDTEVSRFMQSRSSMSAVRPATAPQRNPPRTDHPGSRPSTGPRPSTTTRSSSPMSSDMASSRFFPKSHSTRSSLSSYGEELPPLPSGIGHHIIAPSELYKLNKDVEDDSAAKTRQRSRSRTRSASAADAPFRDDEPRPSLPPPRRTASSGMAPASGSGPPSPMIPMFNTDEPVNNFPATRFSLPTSEFGILETSTPPRPRRSSRRKLPPSEIDTPSAVASPPMPLTPRTPRSPNVPSINVNVSRSSFGGQSSQSTPHDSASPSSASIASHLRSPIRFREIESPRTKWSEREKAARWDDLLQRSEDAGGTLHLGDSGLMSDTIRFSDYSAEA